MEPDKYFVFCYYEEGFNPKVIYINTTKIHNKEVINKISEITNLGPRIIFNYNKSLSDDPKDINNYEVLNGFIINHKLDKSETTLNIINYWLRLLYEVQSDYNNDEKLYQLYIYDIIDDDRKYLSPSDLYDVLSSMTMLGTTSINISRCVMVSEVPFEYKKDIILRYYFTPISKTNNVIEQLKKKQEIIEVISAGSGFGYVHLRNENDAKKLVNKKFKFKDFTIMYDDG